MSIPRVADGICAMTTPGSNGGLDHMAALVTAVQGEHPDGGWIVNLVHFRNGQTSNSTVGGRANVHLHTTEQSARDARAAGEYWPAWQPAPAVEPEPEA